MPRVAAICFAKSLLACAVPGEGPTSRQVKVVLDFQQQGQDRRQGAPGLRRGLNQVTHQILGYREQESSGQSGVFLTATVQ